jgi:hypothetical protein
MVSWKSINKFYQKYNQVGKIMLTKQDIIQKIRDDLYLTGKQSIMNDLPENQNALFIGKLRVPTKLHIEIIQDGLNRFGHVVVCIVKNSKEDKISLPLDKQKQILELIFGDTITIITNTTGNLTSIVNKSPKRIRYILAGSDRVDGYKAQLDRHPSISIVETKRDMSSEDNVSATKVIESIKTNNFTYFKKMMHEKTWPMFDELKPLIKKE